jgi:hypothetical protein
VANLLYDGPIGKVLEVGKPRGDQRWLGKFGQRNKWIFGLSTANMAGTRREHEQTSPAEP